MPHALSLSLKYHVSLISGLSTSRALSFSLENLTQPLRLSLSKPQPFISFYVNHHSLCLRSKKKISNRTFVEFKSFLFKVRRSIICLNGIYVFSHIHLLKCVNVLIYLYVLFSFVSLFFDSNCFASSTDNRPATDANRDRRFSIPVSSASVLILPKPMPSVRSAQRPHGSVN